MEEAYTYHAVYLETPQYYNWTHTHGGPYYVEVGKHIEIAYHTRLNVTHIHNVTVNTSEIVIVNITLNDTNGTGDSNVT